MDHTQEFPTRAEYSELRELRELRVLHGQQAGSTLPLEPGQTYTLGTADSCAVLLSGTQVEPEHLSLSAETEGIHVTPLQGKVTTLDRTEVLPGQLFPLGTVLRLGRIKLTVDSVDAPWPEDDTLEDPEAATPPAPAEAAAPSQPQPAAPAPAKPKPRGANARSLVPTLVLGAVATLLMGATVTAWVSSAGGQAADPAAPAVATASGATAGPAVLDIAQLSREFPEGVLKAARGANGKWVVSGRIASEDSRRRLREAAALLPTTPEVRVMLDSERLAAVTQFVDRRRVAGELELNVQPGGAGLLRIVGAAADQAKLAQLKEQAQGELADAAPVDFAVLLRSDLPAKFEESLRAAGLAPKFKVLRRDSQLELRAVLTSPEVRTWESMFEEFTRQYGSVLTVTAQVQRERDTVETQIETVIAGAFPYVVTTSGRRIAPGGVLEGRTLMAIRGGELVFSDGLRVRYAN